MLLFIIRPKPVKLLFHLVDDLGSFLIITSLLDFFRCKPQSLVVSFQLVELSNPVYKRFGLIYLSYIIGGYELCPDVSQTVDMVYINDVVIKEDVAYIAVRLQGLNLGIAQKLGEHLTAAGTFFRFVKEVIADAFLFVDHTPDIDLLIAGLVFKSETAPGLITVYDCTVLEKEILQLRKQIGKLLTTMLKPVDDSLSASAKSSLLQHYGDSVGRRVKGISHIAQCRHAVHTQSCIAKRAIIDMPGVFFICMLDGRFHIRIVSPVDMTVRELDQQPLILMDIHNNLYILEHACFPLQNYTTLRKL